MARTRRLILVVALLTGALVVLVLASLAVGSRLVPVGTVLEAVTRFDPGSNDQLVIRFSRLPRTLIGVLAGAGLGLAGVLTQSLTRSIPPASSWRAPPCRSCSARSPGR